MATIRVDIDAQNQAKRELNDLQRQINDLNRELAENRKAILAADDAEQKNIRTKNNEIRANQGLLRSQQQGIRLRQQETRILQDAERQRQRIFANRQRLAEQLERNFLSNAERVSREYVREWERAERDRERATREAQAQLERTLRRSQQDFQRLLRPIRAIGRELLTVFTFGGAFVFADFARSIFDASLQMDNLDRSFTALLGSQREANREIQRFRELARLPGVEFATGIRDFQRFVGAGFDPGTARQFIREFGNFASLTGVANQELTRTFRTIRQLQARVTIDQENLNELYENFPALQRVVREEFGAIRAEALRAAGVTPQELLNRLVEGLSRQERAAEDSASNIVQNFRNAFNQLSASVGQQFLPVITQATAALTRFIDDSAPQIVRSAAGMARAILSLNITLTDLQRIATLIASVTGFVALDRLFGLLGKSILATSSATRTFGQAFRTIAAQTFGFTDALNRAASTASVAGRSIGRLAGIIAGIARVSALAAGGFLIFDFGKLIFRLRDTRTETEKLRDELDLIVPSLDNVGSAADRVSENIQKIPASLRQSVRASVENRERIVAQFQEVNRRIAEITDDPFGELERLRARIAQPFEDDILLLDQDAAAQRLLQAQGLGFQFAELNRLLQERLRLSQLLQSNINNFTNSIGKLQVEQERQKTEQLERQLRINRELRENQNQALITEERARINRNRRLDGPRAVDFDVREPGISDPRTQSFERAAVGIERNTGNIFDALRGIQNAVTNVVRLPVTRAGRRAAAVDALGEPGAAVRFPQQVQVPSIADPQAEITALNQAFEDGRGNILDLFGVIRDQARQSFFSIGAQLRANTLPSVFRFTQGLGGLGSLLDDASQKILRNASERNRQLDAEAARLERIRQQRAASIVGIGVGALTDIAGIPGNIQGINQRGQQRLQQVQLDRQRDLERINRDAALSAEQRAERIEEIERTSAQRRIDIERQVNREKGQAYTAFINNAIAGTVDLIRQELQAAAIRAAANQISTGIQTFIAPALAGLGTGGGIGLALAAVAGLQFLGSTLQNRTFHFPNADAEAYLAGRESATARLNVRQNASDFSRDFVRGEQSIEGLQTAQSPLTIQVNAVNFQTDEALAENYVRLGDLMDAGIVVERRG